MLASGLSGKSFGEDSPSLWLVFNWCDPTHVAICTNFARISLVVKEDEGVGIVSGLVSFNNIITQKARKSH